MEWFCYLVMVCVFLKVILVVIGLDVNLNELEKVIINWKNLVIFLKDEDFKFLGRKIMSVVIKGELFLIFIIDY